MTAEFNDPAVTEETLAANRRHDQEHGPVADFEDGRIKGAWNEAKLTRRGRLTDRLIAKYERAGYYTAEYRQARKKLMDKNAKKRKGNFISVDGRLIYNL